MRFLIDTSPKQMEERFNRPIVAGQLQTPLTCYKNWGRAWAADNGAFSKFDANKWFSWLASREPYIKECLFVALPDVVCNARRTLELFDYWSEQVSAEWPIALVAQDGIDDLPIPWSKLQCIFIGGSNSFKDSFAAYDLVKTAKAMNKLVHVGRVNTKKRYLRYLELSADTCDGTGVVKYDHMLLAIEEAAETGVEDSLLFE